MSSPTWFGVYQTDGGWELRKAIVSIETVPTPQGCTSEVTRVSINTAREPLFLVQGLPAFSEGPLEVVFFGNLFVYPGQTHALSGGERVQYQLRAYGTVSEERPDVATSYSLWLSGQPLARFSIVELEVPRLLWAGDLDRDGRLDLFFDLQAGYIGDSYTLFLSSLASLGSFVAKAAELKVSGC